MMVIYGDLYIMYKSREDCNAGKGGRKEKKMTNIKVDGFTVAMDTPLKDLKYQVREEVCLCG